MSPTKTYPPPLATCRMIPKVTHPSLLVGEFPARSLS